MDQLVHQAERLEISPSKKRNIQVHEEHKKQPTHVDYLARKDEQRRIAPSHKDTFALIADNRQPASFWEDRFNSGVMEWGTTDGIPTWLVARQHGNVIVFVLDILRRCHCRYVDLPGELTDREITLIARGIQVGFGPAVTIKGTSIIDCVIPFEKESKKEYRRLAKEFSVGRENIRPIF